MKTWNLKVRRDWVLSRQRDRGGLIFGLIFRRLISPTKSPTLLLNLPTHFHSSFDESVNGNSNPSCIFSAAWLLGMLMTTRILVLEGL
ncbi:hypothetical protein ACFX13_013306 [Malus domestica]